MDYKIKVIDQNYYPTSADVIIELLDHTNSRLIISLDGGGRFEAVASNAFQALRKIRAQTEPKGIRFLIQGCRPNCWPSGMSASMSNGTKIYERQLPLKSDVFLVETFDQASEDEIGTLQEQDNFNKEWSRIRSEVG